MILNQIVRNYLQAANLPLLRITAGGVFKGRGPDRAMELTVNGLKPRYGV